MKKNWIVLFVAIVSFAIATGSFAAEGGDIQITCEPGVRIWLNDEFKGKTESDQNGLFLENLAPGKYDLKAAKTGYQMISRKVTVLQGRTIEVRLAFTSPAMKVESLTQPGGGQPQGPGIGTFILRSAPLGAEVYLDGRKVGSTDTRISNISSGNHRLKFTFKGKDLEGDFFLQPNQTLKLKAHFMKGKIITEFEEIQGAETPSISQTHSPSFQTNSLGMKFAFIPSGSFSAGLSGSQRTFVEAFYLQTTEVTQGQWKAVMNKQPSEFGRCGDDCPVENVSWDDVQMFIQRLNQKEGMDRYRLPTPAEWEYACRAGSSGRYCYGDHESDIGDYAWYKENARGKTHPVASKKPNHWGLYDMHGNVMEWCRDFYAAFEPVARGGDYKDGPKFLSCFVQEISSTSHRSSTIGFRLVRKQ